MPSLPARVILALKLTLGLFILILAAGNSLQPISDPDVFWHLRTGAWIWEHKTLPEKFLFTFTAPATLNVMQHFTMTSYWVFQLVMALFFAAGGWKGIFVLRFLLSALFVWALALRRKGDDLILLGLLALAVMVMQIYSFERPQASSFIFFALLLEQLDWLRRSPAGADRVPLRRVIALPLLMVAWANCHGGYVIGQGVIALYLAVEAVKHLHPSLGPLCWKRYRLLLMIGTAGLLASLVNPNTYHGFEVALLPSWSTASVREYLPTIALFRESGAIAIIAYWFLLGLAVLGTFLSATRLDLTRIALLALTGYFSFTQSRYVAFLAVTALPIVQEALSRERFRTIGRILVLAPAVLVGLTLLKQDWGYLKDRPALFGVNFPLFPTDAADFLETAKIQGQMYNYFGWGGYLSWRLAPAEVFIDGRNSDHDLFDKYKAFDSGTARVLVDGRPYWKSMFKSFGIRYTVTPFFDHYTGTALPLLLDYLAADPDWVAVFIGLNSVVYVENTTENRAVIERFSIPRREVLPALLDRCEWLIRESPGDPRFHIAKGDVLIYLSRFSEAKASLERASALAPASPQLRTRLDWLQRRGTNERPAR